MVEDRSPLLDYLMRRGPNDVVCDFPKGSKLSAKPIYRRLSHSQFRSAKPLVTLLYGLDGLCLIQVSQESFNPARQRPHKGAFPTGRKSRVQALLRSKVAVGVAFQPSTQVY